MFKYWTFSPKQLIQILLFCVILISGIAIFSSVTAKEFNRILGTHYSIGIPVEILSVIFILLIILILLVNKLNLRVIISFVMLILISGSLYTLIKWGADVPQGLLTLSLALIVSSVVFGSKFTFYIQFLLSISLLLITYYQIHINYADIGWKANKLGYEDTFVHIATFSAITLVGWLYNREIENTFNRLKKSQAELQKQKDILEETVIKRTRQLKFEEMEKLSAIQRFVDFGKLSAGLVHDIVNPLTTAYLNLEEAKNNTKTISSRPNSQNSQKIKNAVNNAMQSLSIINTYITSARMQLDNKNIIKSFAIKHVVNNLFKMYSYLLVQKGITLKKEIRQNLTITGNPALLQQALSNLISNSAESFQEESHDKIITIRSYKKLKTLYIEVTDTGSGISPKKLHEITEPFFSTKKNSNLGLGLSIVQKIIEESFKGTLAIESKIKEGTTVTLTIPLS